MLDENADYFESSIVDWPKSKLSLCASVQNNFADNFDSCFFVQSTIWSLNKPPLTF